MLELKRPLAACALFAAASSLSPTGPTTARAEAVAITVPENERPVLVEQDAAAQKAQSLPGAPCMADLICKLRPRIGRKRQTWSQTFCKKIADGIISSARRHNLNPSLLLAIAINESDLDENAEGGTEKRKTLVAKDGGLMGIRCIVDRAGVCTNGPVRDIPWRKLIEPIHNIEMGARILANYRDGGSVEIITEKGRNGAAAKTRRVVTHYTRCAHKTHAFWAHYNHGPTYLDEGYPRHYPHRVAVLYHAITQALGLPVPSDLTRGAITMRDPGQPRRTVDRPVEVRYRTLTEYIMDAAGSCQGVAAVSDQHGLN